MKIIVKQIDNINSELFNIYDDKNILPAALSIKGLHYQISGFQNNTDEYIYYGEYSAIQAINLLVSCINNISFKTLMKVYEICQKLNADINKINIFQEKNIKGRKSFETLEKALGLPENLIDFIDEKDIPLKTISLIINQQANVINFIAEHIKYNDFSMQGFRKYVEKVCDFKDIIPEKYRNDFIFPDTRSKSHIEIDEKYAELVNNFKNIKINNLDSFETPKLNIYFDINNIKDYENMLNILEKNKLNIQLFYELLEKYGLK